MKKMLTVLYSGDVQGIGFRFTAKRIAEELQLTGWVTNLSDGRVEIRAEADEEVLKDFLLQINNAFSRYIQNVELDWGSATGEFCDFIIRF